MAQKCRFSQGPLDVFNGNNGAVYLYRLSGAADTPFGAAEASWVIDDKLFATDGAANDRFGWAVAVSQSDDDDGAVTVIVGARGDDNAGSNSGSAYVLDVRIVPSSSPQKQSVYT
jgi:hypothetical protein